MGSLAVQRALGINLGLLQEQLVRHGHHSLLFKDILRSWAVWAGPAATARLAERFSSSQVPFGRSSLEHGTTDMQPRHLSGSDLDAAFATLKLLSTRVAALSRMAHQPCSCNTTPSGLSIATQSWLLPHKRPQQQYWQYGYELSIRNASNEPLQLLSRDWDVKELSGECRHRSSRGLLGVQALLSAGQTVSYRTAITLDCIKGSMAGNFRFRGIGSGVIHNVPVTPFALTPTAAQFSDPNYMSADLLHGLGVQQSRQQSCKPVSSKATASAAVVSETSPALEQPPSLVTILSLK